MSISLEEPNLEWPIFKRKRTITNEGEAATIALMEKTVYRAMDRISIGCFAFFLYGLLRCASGYTHFIPTFCKPRIDFLINNVYSVEPENLHATDFIDNMPTAFKVTIILAIKLVVIVIIAQIGGHGVYRGRPICIFPIIPTLMITSAILLLSSILHFVAIFIFMYRIVAYDNTPLFDTSVNIALSSLAGAVMSLTGLYLAMLSYFSCVLFGLALRERRERRMNPMHSPGDITPPHPIEAWKHITPDHPAFETLTMSSFSFRLMQISLF